MAAKNHFFIHKFTVIESSILPFSGPLPSKFFDFKLSQKDEFMSYEIVLGLIRRFKKMWNVFHGKMSFFAFFHLLRRMVKFKKNFTAKCFEQKKIICKNRNYLQSFRAAKYLIKILHDKNSSFWLNLKIQNLSGLISESMILHVRHFRLNQIEHFYFMEWALSDPAVLCVLTICGTKDTKTFQTKITTKKWQVV